MSCYAPRDRSVKQSQRCMLLSSNQTDDKKPEEPDPAMRGETNPDIVILIQTERFLGCLPVSGSA